MVFLVALLTPLVLACSVVVAGPVALNRAHGFPPVPITPKGLLCRLPVPIIQKLLCPRQGSTNPTVNTPLGTATGVVGSDNVKRFAVRYGNAARWQPASLVTSWQLPAGNTDPSQLPKACPQDGVDDDAMSEDCLSMILFVPSSVSSGSNVPVMVWVHGGSFTDGSATGPGLDGSALAAKTNSVVAVIQYRLGVLGLHAPNGNQNLALQDTILSLKFLQKTAPSFGGSASKITVAGQSSGANMIRGLLAAPSASSLFQNAILESDPMAYGFLSTATHTTLQNYFNGLFNCDPTNADCANGLSLDDILDAQDNLFNAALSLDPSVGVGERIRIVKDGSLITTTLDTTTPFPAVSKPVLITNVKNEAATSIFGGVPAITASDYASLVEQTFGESATNAILKNVNYAVAPASNNSNSSNGVTTDQRPLLEKLGTDQIWRCPTWTFARNWVGNGGKAYVGMYTLGASYPGNTDATSFCAQPGVVCHQDDIEIVFGTAPNPSAQQSALISEMQARYNAFLHTGNPNVPGLANWKLATTTDVHALFLGSSGEMPAGGCDPDFFGKVVPYDYQVFNI